MSEHVLAELLVLAPGGVEEEQGPGWVSYAIYGAPGELPELGSIEAIAGGERIDVSSEEIPDDWADRWRDFHEPVLIAGRVLVRPSWLGTQDGDAELCVVVIDPGQAFGTGAHPTTAMSIELLVELAGAGKARAGAVDLGTGSGVLAIAAAKLGWDSVLAVDNEAAAVDAAQENARLNGVEVECLRANLREGLPPLGETLIANLTAPLLQDVAERIGGREDHLPRRLVCSGMLGSQVGGVASAFERAGLTVTSRLESGDWAAMALERR
ncbi:MAG: 50S ribosomal protein L11 methyltransferase [Solirubrobacterales bacterium]